MPLKFSFLLFLLLPLLLPSAAAQVKLSRDFNNILQKGHLQFFSPIENTFKSIRVRKNRLRSYDMAMRSKNKKLEIRYAISPYQGQDLEVPPHLNCVSVASSVATNNQDALITVHRIDSSFLAEEYNADWGATVFFRPKKEFSKRKHCKMLVLYATQKASVYIFYLFDEPDEQSDYPSLLRFKD